MPEFEYKYKNKYRCQNTNITEQKISAKLATNRRSHDDDDNDDGVNGSDDKIMIYERFVLEIYHSSPSSSKFSILLPIDKKIQHPILNVSGIWSKNNGKDSAIVEVLIMQDKGRRPTKEMFFLGLFSKTGDPPTYAGLRKNYCSYEKN